MAKNLVEAEFRAMAQEMCETLWLKKLLHEMQIAVKSPIKL